MLPLNLVASTFVFAIAAWIYVAPRLGSLTPLAVLQPILLLHAMRHLGMMFLSPGATMAGIPERFTVPAAYGDLIAAVLAIAIALATIHDAEPFMGAASWIRRSGCRRCWLRTRSCS